MEEQAGVAAGKRDRNGGGQAVNTLTAAGQLIADLDLERVRELARRDYHWHSEAEVEKAEQEYRDFLSVCWNWWKTGHRGKLAGIGRGADRMWHCHMLLPCKYGTDCERIFGEDLILDHDPFFTESDMPWALEVARAAYAAIDKPFPTDQISACQWSIVTTVAR